MNCHLNAIRSNQMEYLQSLSLDDWNSIRNEWNIPAGHMIIMENSNSCKNDNHNHNHNDDKVMKMIELMNAKGYDLTTTADIVCSFTTSNLILSYLFYSVFHFTSSSISVSFH